MATYLAPAEVTVGILRSLDVELPVDLDFPQTGQGHRTTCCMVRHDGEVDWPSRDRPEGSCPLANA